jgi:2-phosphosulfolactate phosphatase
VKRRVRVFGSYRNLSDDAVAGLDVVIVDVLRATSTIADAVARGARVLPLAGIADALARGKELGAKAVLVGERMGAPLPGFHCNNSTTELAAIELRRKVMILTTTNGTQAVAACRAAHRIFAGALTNAPAVGANLCRRGALQRDVAIVCAGRATGALALEDLLGAGAVVDAIARATRTGELWLADGSRVALALFRRERSRLRAALRACDAGHELVAKGSGADVDAAAAHGRIRISVVLRDALFVAAR